MSGRSIRRPWLRARAAARVGAARVRERPWQSLLVVVGVAGASALLAGVLGGSLIARNRALQREIAELPAADRTIRADLFGLAVQQDFAGEDDAARRALSTLGAQDPIRVSFFRDSLVDGELIRLVGIDDLSRFVSVSQGRLPRRCRPDACEVIQVHGTGRPALRQGGIDLVRTGIGEVRDRALLGPSFQSLHTHGTQEGVRSPTVLVASSTAALERIPTLRLLFRVRSWIDPISPAAIRSWQIGDVLARESSAQTALHEADPAFKLSGPDAALLAARDRGSVSGRRMVLLGAGASVLLFGFVMVCAMGLRRSFASERRRMLQRGSTRPQVWIALLVEVGAVTFVASVAGVALGALFVAVLADVLGLPAAATVRHALLEPHAILALVLIWALAAVVVVGTTASTDTQETGRRVRILDVAAVGAAVAVALAATRGAFGSDSLASGRSQSTLLLLPLLVCFVGAVVAARLLGPLMLLGERVSRRGPTALRLALLSLSRAPARTAAACAFLVVAVGLAVFAASYRATLVSGARDESAFEVPLDVALSGGGTLVSPLDAASLASFGGLAPSVRAFPVLQSSADVSGVGSSSQGVTVLGIPSAAFARMHWRDDFSPTPRSVLGRRLFADGPVRLRGAPIPADAVSLSARVALRGMHLHLDLALADARGRVEIVRLGHAGPGRAMLTARLPRGEHTPVLLTGVLLSLTRNGTSWFYHLAQEGRLIRAQAGALTLEALRPATRSGRRLAAIDTGSWVVRGTGIAVERRRPLRVGYSFSEVTTFVLRPVEPTDGRPLRVVASPAVALGAGPGGLLTLDANGAEVPARVVGVARRFPRIDEGEPFVVADESRLSTALDADSPGTGTPDQLWLSVSGTSERQTEARLSRQPFSELELASRRAVLARLERDPLAEAIGYTLGAAALVALALAVIGLWVTLVSDLHDERSTFFDLEAQGATPELLRAQARIRALGVFAFGVVGGVLLGLVLSRLVVSLVQVSAGTDAPEPPLVLQPGWTTIGLALVGLLVAGAIAIEASLRGSFRGETPERAAWTLE